MEGNKRQKFPSMEGTFKFSHLSTNATSCKFRYYRLYIVKIPAFYCL